MKALSTHPELLKTFYNFEYPYLGYPSLLVPHSEETRAKLMRDDRAAGLAGSWQCQCRRQEDS